MVPEDQAQQSAGYVAKLGVMVSDGTRIVEVLFGFRGDTVSRVPFPITCRSSVPDGNKLGRAGDGSPAGKST